MSALEFRQLETKKGNTPRVCADPLHSKGGAARWRVAIADHPVLEGRWALQMFVCTPCRQRLEAEWADALGIEEAKAA